MDCCRLGFHGSHYKKKHKTKITGGTRTFPSSNIFLFLGQGVEIVNDEPGNVWATRGSKNNIFVKVEENVTIFQFSRSMDLIGSYG